MVSEYHGSGRQEENGGVFEERLQAWQGGLTEALTILYGPENMAKIRDRLLDIARQAHLFRSGELRRLDRRRETVDKDWFQSEKMAGYMCYPDRFAGTFDGVVEKIGYLKDLGVTYLHLLSVLRAREGDSDGGFAVTDYLKTNAHLGDIDGLEKLAQKLRANGISLCLDLVLNHTAREHVWAQKAMAGDPYYRKFYFMFDDRKEPDRYEKKLEQIFPATQPGNFTYVPECDQWVWTTFYPYQWDLNYHNPEVLFSMVEILLNLANRGIEVFRLDAAIFLWKEKDTNCRNLPQAHALLRIFKTMASIAAPGVILKAEAVSSARHLTGYLGNHRHRECDIAYHTALMTALWDSLATADATVMTRMMRALPPKPRHTAWVHYIRCHDDIGWEVLKDPEQTEWGASDRHLAYLSGFYEGACANSFARGRSFQMSGTKNYGGTNGTLASLAGIEQALENGTARALGLAEKRIILLYAVIAALDGMPMIYMGDELASLNDYDYMEHGGFNDGRWLHRGKIEWQDDVLPPSLRQSRKRIFTSLVRVLHKRRSLPVLNAANPIRYIDFPQKPIFGFVRESARQRLLCLANFSDAAIALNENFLQEHNFTTAPEDVCPVNEPGEDVLMLTSYQCRWLIAEREA